MTFQLTEVIVAVLSLAGGWAALWPARRSVGAWGYHVVAFPLGLVSWTVVAVASTTLGRPFDLVSSALGVLTFVLVLQLAIRLAIRHEIPTGAAPGGASYAITAASLVLAAVVLAAARLTIASPDSWGVYWPLSVGLARDGAITAAAIASRGMTLIAINAAGVALGGDWAYAIYPLMSLATLAILVTVLAAGAFASLGRRAAVAAGVATALVAATTATYVYHSFYVHSHMISALYLLLAMAGVLMASDSAPVRGALARSDAWLVVAGAATGGLALARPDGLAHLFLPVVVALSVLTTPDRDRRSDIAFFGPLLFIVGSVYVPLFVRYSLWPSDKLSGTMALALVVLLALSALVPATVRAIDRRVPFRIGGYAFLAAAVSGAALLLLAAFIVRWDTASLAAAHAYINLLGGEGGWRLFWWGLLALLGLSVLTGDAARPDCWSRTLFLTILLYVVFLGLIHGITAPGRIGVGATLNRVAFHIVPVVMWYLGVVAGRILGEWQTGWRTSQVGRSAGH